MWETILILPNYHWALGYIQPIDSSLSTFSVFTSACAASKKESKEHSTIWKK